MEAESNEINANDDQPLLIVAARSGNAGMTSLLLQTGSDPNDASYLGVCPLSVAAYFQHSEVAQILLKGGALVSESNLCNRGGTGRGGIMLLRARLHLWAREIVDRAFAFSQVFPQGCSTNHWPRCHRGHRRWREGGAGLLCGKEDVLSLMRSFVLVKTPTVVRRLEEAVSHIESIEWENVDEWGSGQPGSYDSIMNRI